MHIVMDAAEIQSRGALFSTRQIYGHLINGESVGGHSGALIELGNPTTGEHIASIQAGDATDVDRAVNAAHAAFPKWSQTSSFERQALMRAIAERLRERRLDFSLMEALNNGKPISEAYRHDMSEVIGLFDYYAGTSFHLKGDTVDFPNASMFVHREPIGVVAQIIPWNVPLLMAAFKIAPALAAGCTIVLKPAETVCLSVMEFAKDLAELLPPGVVNIVTGYGEAVGEPLVTHPLVRKVAFTGSRGTAQKIIGYAAKGIIPQTMELGGKSANIVCADADLDTAAESIIISTIFNKGEVCLAGSRVFVHSSVQEALLEKCHALLAKVRQGDPTDPRTQLGAQASRIQYDRVMGYIALGREEGAEVLAGGGGASVPGFEKGLFIQPTLFGSVHNSMRIAQEEIFGPVTAFISWDDEADMLRQVNDNPYGLGGGIWTNDLAKAHRISRAMQTGMIWINRYYNFMPGQPIGGYKQSGFGRENTLDTLQHYTVTKSVVVNLEPGPIGVFDH